MNLKSDFLSRSIELLRSQNTSLLSGSEELLSWQIDSSQAFITRSSQQLRTILSDIAKALEPATCQEGLQNLLLDTLKMSHDTLLASTDYQMESTRLLQKQANEAQETLAALMNGQLSHFGEVIPAYKNQETKHRLAA